MKIRKYKLATQRVVIFLRTQEFRDYGLEVDLSGPTQFPNDLTFPFYDVSLYSCDILFSTP
jgi:hypothetical protein